MHTICFLICIVSFVFTGCASTGTEQVSIGQGLLANGQNVVPSIDRLAYQRLDFGDPIEFTFGEESTVLIEGEYRRFVKGLSLPTDCGSYSVGITSFMGGTLYDPAILYPEVRVLDEHYQTIKVLPHTSFVLRTVSSGKGLNTVFFVNNNTEGERYLLIFNRSVSETDLTVSQSNITETMVFSNGVATWFIYTGYNTPPVKMKASATGRLEVALQKYQPKRVGE